MNNTNFKTYADKNIQAKELASVVANELQITLQNQDHALLAVAGGTTPLLFLQHLSAEKLAWEKVTIIATDERQVPTNSSDSNTKLITDNLLQNEAKEAIFIAFYDGASLAQVQERLAPLLPLCVCVVGMGEDKHTASLFPDCADIGLADNAPILLEVLTANSPLARISLSARVLRDCQYKHLLITGEGKKRALEEAYQELDKTKAPIKIILDDPNALVHFTN